MCKLIVTSMCTIDTPYEKEIERLIKSMKKFDLEYHIERFKNTGNWTKNCKYNTECIKNTMVKFPRRNILYVDADAEFLEKPILFYRKDIADIALHMIQYEKHIEHCTGTLFIKNNISNFYLMSKWDCLNRQREDLDDQQCLELVLKEVDYDKVLNLPKEYCYIPGNRIQKLMPTQNVIIKHYQASRKYKKLINDKRNI